MTPPSTDRSHALSPLEIFSPAVHSPATAPHASRGFEDVLNHATPQAKVAPHRQPVREECPTEKVREESSEKSHSSAGRKQTHQTGQPNRPQRWEDDSEPRDEPTQDSSACPMANDFA